MLYMLYVEVEQFPGDIQMGGAQAPQDKCLGSASNQPVPETGPKQFKIQSG